MGNAPHRKMVVAKHSLTGGGPTSVTPVQDAGVMSCDGGLSLVRAGGYPSVLAWGEESNRDINVLETTAMPSSSPGVAWMCQ